MTHKLLLLACCVLFCSTTSTLAQRRGGAAADPISGTWTGELVRENASTPRPVTLELKFDGKSAVTGTMSGMPNPADVKRGTFDTKTGALKLEMGRTSDPAVLLVFDGTVSKGKATGKITGDATGQFTLTKKP